MVVFGLQNKIYVTYYPVADPGYPVGGLFGEGDF